MEQTSTLNYVCTSALDVDVQMKVGVLQGLKMREKDYDELLKDDMIGYSGRYQKNKIADLMVVLQVFSKGRPITISISTCYKSFTTHYNWNEWIILPLKFNELPRDAVVALTIYDCAGATKLKPIGGTTVSMFGKYGIFRQGLLDLYVWPDVVADGHNNTTPGLLKHTKTKMQSLYKLMRKHRNQDLPKIDWLDRLSFREMEQICDAEKKSSNELYLSIEFPQISCCGNSILVVYFEEESIYHFNPVRDVNELLDPEIAQDNLVENKHHKLSRSVRNRPLENDTKPNSETRDLLKHIVAYPPMKCLTGDEQDLIWKYRFYLSDQKKALVKLLKCVNWSLGLEVQQALDMMKKWVPIDTDDALQLLTPSFSHPVVRQYAVSCLMETSNDNLLLYFLQLVQALRYEDPESITKVFNEMQLVIAHEGPDITVNYFLNELLKKCNMSCTYLLSFLILRACHNFKLANNFFWYLTAECENDLFTTSSNKICEMYLQVMTLFTQALKYGDSELQKKYTVLKNQELFLNNLVQLIKLVMRETGNRAKKVIKLQTLLAENIPPKFQFSSFDPIPFPLDPDVIITGIVPDKAILFKSKLMPSRLTFITSKDEEYVAIFKYGDDLRQDQLVLQVITLIDNLLKNENLDLKLTPYKVLATSTKHGFVQCVDSFSVADILTKEGSLQAFFRKQNQNNTGPYGISSDIMDTYVKSCAGYCVITYLLGVGDRHLDNLMVTPNGNLFHIDFGYILGRDPKPLPPAMKLTKEMVEAMGGQNSEHYSQFKKLCFTAFLNLRRHTDLIINLFSLMTDTNIPDIALEPDKAVKKIEDKLCLELGDEEAVQHFQNLLDSSVADVMAVIVDQLHKFTQYCRA